MTFVKIYKNITCKLGSTYIHLSGRRVCHFCNKCSSSSTLYKTGFNLAYVLEAAKLIIVETWERWGGARLARAGKGCSSVLCLGGGNWNPWGGGGELPPCAPHRQWIVHKVSKFTHICTTIKINDYRV